MLTHQLQGAFEDAYEKAAASSQPDDWMNAALLGKQFSNAYREASRHPAAYQYLFTSPIGGGDVWRSESSYWNGQRPKASRALFSVPISRVNQAPANLEGLAKALLAPREIVRDADGWLDHHALPVCDEGVRFDELLSAIGLETYFLAMDGDAPQEVADRYFEHGEGNCSAWTPTPPEGDGWLLLAIYDTEDGPYAMFARRKQPKPIPRHRLRKIVLDDEQQPEPVGDGYLIPQFLTDVLTAAGLVAHGKQSKALAERLSGEAMKFRAAWAAQSGQRTGVAEDVEKAIRFAGMVFKAHRNDGYPGDVDGDHLQRIALECGLIEEREVSESCGANCSCADVGEFPSICYFNTKAAKDALDAAATPTQLQESPK